MKCCVYRHFDSSGQLLYVGMSIDPFNRWSQGYGNWRYDVVRLEIEWFGSREDASIAERKAIIAEDPLHNGTRYKSGLTPKPAKPKPQIVPLQLWPAGEAGFQMRVAMHNIEECEKYGIPLDCSGWKELLAEAKKGIQIPFKGLLDDTPLEQVDVSE